MGGLNLASQEYKVTTKVSNDDSQLDPSKADQNENSLQVPSEKKKKSSLL